MGKLLKRAAMSTAALITATTAAVGLSSGTAQADTGEQWVHLSTSNGVGVYKAHDPNSVKVGPDMWSPDDVYVLCFASGSYVGTHGNVWYKTSVQWYSRTNEFKFPDAWVFAPYVDNAAKFRDGSLPRCP